MPPSVAHLFEAPPSHLEAGDRTYHRWLDRPGPSALESAFGWEESDAEHTGPPTTASQARNAFRRLRPGYARRLGVGPGGQVHHKIELQVLNRYPGAFSPRELNHIRNMRGIPGEVDSALFVQRQNALLADLQKRNVVQGTPAWDAAVRAFSAGLRATGMPKKQLHNSYIRTYWNRHYTQLGQNLQDPRFRANADAARQYVRRYLIAAMRGLDAVTQGMYTEHRARQRWTPAGPSR